VTVVFKTFVDSLKRGRMLRPTSHRNGSNS
jgi:hypothetical protein